MARYFKLGDEIILEAGAEIWSSSNTKIYSGIYNEQEVVVKVPNDEEDRKMNNHKKDLLKRESEIYDAMHHLQGTHILEKVMYGVTEQERFLPFLMLKRYPYSLEKILPDVTLEQGLSYLGDIAQTLSLFHEVHLTHQDVRPQNMYPVDEDALLGDFGITKVVSAGGRIGWGAHPYAPEEQIHGGVIRPDDVYAVGITLLQIGLGLRFNDFYDLFFHSPYTPISEPPTFYYDLIKHINMSSNELHARILKQHSEEPGIERLYDRFIELIMWMIQPKNTRPVMEEVAHELGSF